LFDSLQILCTFLLASPLKTGHVTHPYFFNFFIPKFYLTEKPDEKREMMRNKVLREDDIQKLHTTAPEQLTDQELLLSTISAADLARKHSGGWDKVSQVSPLLLQSIQAQDFYSPVSHDLSGNSQW